jgi:hypothetical protein
MAIMKLRTFKEKGGEQLMDFRDNLGLHFAERWGNSQKKCHKIKHGAKKGGRAWVHH